MPHPYLLRFVLRFCPGGVVLLCATNPKRAIIQIIYLQKTKTVFHNILSLLCGGVSLEVKHWHPFCSWSLLLVNHIII